MAGSNAGKKRNRLRTGVVAWKGVLTLDPSYGSALEAAAAESGSWATSLYMQRLLEQVAEHDADGNVKFPVLSPDLTASKEVRSTAA